MTDLADVAGEGVLIAGGGRAILLQIADPRIGLAVARHSDFAERPLDRLHGTLSFVYAQVFGTEQQRRETARRVNRAHAPVHSGDTARHGEHYNAFDADAQLWVAATLYDTAITLFEHVFGPIPAPDAERVYRGYAVLGTALQVPADAWPVDRAAFRAYIDDRMRRLRVTPEARRVAHDLLHPRRGALWLRAVMPVARLVTVGLLDDTLRTAYGFRWTPARARRFAAVMRMTRVVWPRLPRVIRTAPRDAYLRRLNRSAAV